MDDEREERPGYGVHDVFVNWSPSAFEKLKLNASINNMFDKDYETVFSGVAAEGRSYNLSVSMDW